MGTGYSFGRGGPFWNGIPMFGGGSLPLTRAVGQYWWVDGTHGSNGNTGKNATQAFSTITKALSVAAEYDVILVLAKEMAVTDTDPGSYAETFTISKAGVAIIGVSRGLTQGGLPQVKIGAGSTAMATIAAPGCFISNLGFNGASSTGGGILLDDDGGSTKSAFGTTVVGCHFKNCKGSAAASTGGGIMWAATGGAWQVHIEGNKFYNNRAGIVLMGTSGSRPQDVTINGNYFYSSANTTVDADIYLSGGSGVDGLVIDSNVFGTVDVPAYATSPDAARYLDLTGCTDGILSRNMFACIINTTATEVTLGAAGTAAKIPTTIRMAGNYGESTTGGDWGSIHRT